MTSMKGMVPVLFTENSSDLALLTGSRFKFSA